jgi:hypothetical protein
MGSLQKVSLADKPARFDEHRPVADDEVHVLLFQAKSTVNTGTAGGERTRQAEWI